MTFYSIDPFQNIDLSFDTNKSDQQSGQALARTGHFEKLQGEIEEEKGDGP